MGLGFRAGGTKRNMIMDTEDLSKIINEQELSTLREVDIQKFEDAVERDSEEVVLLSKRFFWNNVIVIGFMLYGLLYVLLTRYPQKAVIGTTIFAILVASAERLYIHNKIKKAVSRIAASAMIIEFLKKIKK
jgi:hypothetical protein